MGGREQNSTGCNGRGFLPARYADGCIVAEGSKARGHSFDVLLFSLAIPALLHEVRCICQELYLRMTRAEHQTLSEPNQKKKKSHFYSVFRRMDGRERIRLP